MLKRILPPSHIPLDGGLSQDTRLEVTPDTTLGTFPSNPLSRPIFKPNLIAYCVTGAHTIERDTKP